MGACPAQSEIRHSTLGEAVALLEQALRIIDAANAPSDVGARLAEVIERLKDVDCNGPAPG